MTIKLFELDKKLEIARCGQLSPIIDGKSTLAHVENSISAQKRQIAVLPARVHRKLNFKIDLEGLIATCRRERSGLKPTLLPTRTTRPTVPGRSFSVYIPKFECLGPDSVVLYGSFGEVSARMKDSGKCI